MKARAILLASVLLVVGCQASKNDANIQQHVQNFSAAASQREARKCMGWAQLMDDNKFCNNPFNKDCVQKKDLWVFIGNELKMGVPENFRIREQKQKYLHSKNYIYNLTLRAEPYMYWIVGQLKKRNMPMELALLPIVESAFDPNATSDANAAGIWQIIPSTGRSYGLKQTRGYDARRDVVASTTTALDIMQHLNKIFGGDWLLTIAAYNSGEGRVMQALKTNKAHGKPTDFWSLALPHETRVYVPKMLALSDIVKNGRRYNVKLSKTDEGRALACVHLDSPAKLRNLACMAGISVEKLRTFNAGVSESTLGASSPKYVLVPQKYADQLRESLASAGGSKVI